MHVPSFLAVAISAVAYAAPVAERTTASIADAETFGLAISDGKTNLTLHAHESQGSLIFTGRGDPAVVKGTRFYKQGPESTGQQSLFAYYEDKSYGLFYTDFGNSFGNTAPVYGQYNSSLPIWGVSDGIAYPTEVDLGNSPYTCNQTVDGEEAFVLNVGLGSGEERVPPAGCKVTLIYLVD